MLLQPKTIDSFIAMLSNEAARPVALDASISARTAAVDATVERFEREPLDTGIDAFLTAQTTKLALTASRESFDRIRMETRQLTLTTAACVTHKPAGKAILEAELAERTKGRAAKHAALGKAAAAHQTALMNPDLSPDEWGALENLRAGLVGQAESLEVNLSNAKSAIERFSNVPSAETWHDAVRAVRAVNFA